MNQGSKANKCGNQLEKTVSNSLSAKNFTVVPYLKWKKKPLLYGNELLICNYPYISIYGTHCRTEFYLSSIKYNKKIRIECKWQQVSGSVDEKYPYLYLNCIKVPEKDIIILLDGGGYKPEAKKWLENTIKNKEFQDINNPKNIQLMDITKFYKWVNNTF